MQSTAASAALLRPACSASPLSGLVAPATAELDFVRSPAHGVPDASSVAGKTAISASPAKASMSPPCAWITAAIRDWQVDMKRLNSSHPLVPWRLYASLSFVKPLTSTCAWLLLHDYIVPVRKHPGSHQQYKIDTGRLPTH
eukprot:scaffold175413_cov45-Prasinocladus_malaysianus.AAC.1